MKQIIGLTGLYCSGKSTVERMLSRKLGFYVIDVDKVGHRALVTEQDRLVEAFSETILTGGKVDRKKLGPLVFKDKKKLELLNSIVHPVMVKSIEQDIASRDGNICISAALLFEMGLDVLCSKIIVVKAPVLRIAARGKKRDGHSFLRILSILFSQKVLSLAKKNCNNVDIYSVNNNKTEDHLFKVVKTIAKKQP